MKLKWLLLVVLIASVVLVYYKSLDDPMFFDDHALTGLSVDADKTFPMSWNPKDLRPGRSLAMWTFNVVHHYSQSIEAQRAFNILIHILNSLLVFLLISRFTENRPTAYLTAFLFALNPAAIFATSYLIERTILMATFFGLIQIILYMEAFFTRWRDSIIYIFFSLIAYGFAISCKEHAVPLVMVYLLLPLCLPNSFKRMLCIYASFILIGYVLNFLVGYSSAFGNESGAYYKDIVQNLCGIQGDVAQRSMATQSVLFFKYIWMWVNPFEGRSVDMRYPFAEIAFSKPYVYGLAAYAGVFALGLWLTVKKNLLGFPILLLWFLQLVEIQTVRVGEMFVIYRSYLFSICYVMIFGYLFNKLKLSYKSVAILGVGLVSVFGWCTFKDLNQFQSSLFVWQQASDVLDTRAICQSSRIYGNLSAQLLRANVPEKAYNIGKAGLAFGDHFAGAVINTAIACHRTGRLDEALKYYKIALAKGGDVVKPIAQMGVDALGGKNE